MDKFFKDKYTIIPLIATLFFLALIYGFAYVDLFTIDKSIIFHLNINGMIDLFVGFWQLVSIITGFLILSLVNFLLSYVLYFKSRILSYFLLFASAWVSVIGVVVFYSATLLN